MTKARDIASASPAPSTVSATELGYLDGVSSAIQTQIDGKVASSLVDAKGDLLVGSADNTLSRLAVSDNGSTLVADSSATTGLRWGNNYGFTAGKNKILNADFRLNQRAFTSSTTTATYGFDRWRFTCDGGTVTYSAQTFTAGAAPVAGYEAINYARLVTSGQSAASDRALLNQLIEDVRTCAGQTVTVSFWAQAGSGTPKVNVVLNQNFGTGGSASVNAPIPTAQTISTSWARYSFTIDVPSVSGKTISATDSRLNVQLYVSDGGNQSTGVGAQNNTFNIWGVQVETGSVATAFQTATGTLAGELAACQRYYLRTTANATYAYVRLGIGTATSTTAAAIQIPLPVTMRSTVTTLGATNLGLYSSGSIVAVTSLASDQLIGQNIGITANVASGLTQDRAYQLIVNNSSTGYLELGAEL